MSQPRDQKKARLLRNIQQQRLDLAANKKSLVEATAPYDRYWNNLLQWRKFWVVGSGIIAIYGVRHPSKLIRWGRRAAGLWGTLRFFRKAISKR